MLSNTAKLESKKKPLLNEISTRKKIKETPKDNYQKRQISKKGIKVNVKVQQNCCNTKKKRQQLKTLWMQLLKQQTNDKIVGRYCKQRN